ncbi:hypothetical protein GLOIN_2v1789077 [Rhizophagus irregularis DAOM 181602=DAOM 197198]|nr:hypothetical protein GLOIN_2v1789077 [Rhizophagus irregularis DAOM 181602=DAOM 197198]
MTPEQQREQFIRGLNTMNQYNIRMMAKFYDTQDNITKALAEAEKYTLSQKSEPSSFPIFPSANPYIDTNRSGGGMTKNEIEDLIKTTMASSQPQTAQQNTDLQSSIKSLQETMSRVTKTLDNMPLRKNVPSVVDLDILPAILLLILPRQKEVKKESESEKLSSKEMSSAKLREIPLEETIRKVLHSELKLIFSPHFFQDSGLIASKQIVASTEAKIVSQNDVSSSSKDLDESSLEEESLDDPMPYGDRLRQEEGAENQCCHYKVQNQALEDSSHDSRLQS